MFANRLFPASLSHLAFCWMSLITLAFSSERARAQIKGKVGSVERKSERNVVVVVVVVDGKFEQIDGAKWRRNDAAMARRKNDDDVDDDDVMKEVPPPF